MSAEAQPMGVEHHGKMLLAASIGRHPARAATVLSALIVITVILIGYVAVFRAKWKACVNPKSGFDGGTGMVKISNFARGTNNPLWHVGSLAAGGLFERDPVSEVQTAAYVVDNQPPVQRTLAKRASFARLSRMAAGRREGWAQPDPTSGACPPGQRVVTPDEDPSGMYVNQCGTPADIAGIIDMNAPIQDPETDPDLPHPGTCGSDWGGDAALEAQALAAVGGFAPDTYAADRLQNAAGGSYNSNRGLSDAQLTSLMRFGVAP